MEITSRLLVIQYFICHNIFAVKTTCKNGLLNKNIKSIMQGVDVLYVLSNDLTKSNLNCTNLFKKNNDTCLHYERTGARLRTQLKVLVTCNLLLYFMESVS